MKHLRTLIALLLTFATLAISMVWYVSPLQPELTESTVFVFGSVGLLLTILIGLVIYHQSLVLEQRVAIRTGELESEIDQLKRRDDRFRIAVESSPAAMIMVETAGSILHANLEAERLFRYSPGQLIGKSIDMLVPEMQRAKHSSFRKMFLKDPSNRRMGGRNLDAQRKNGETFPVEVGLTPIDTTEGMLILCAVVDLTEQKSFEKTILAQTELLQKANERLYHEATFDSLTNIANRRSLYAQIETFLRLSRRNAQPVSILMADIDYFKQYNDDIGHLGGDRALQVVAQKLSDTGRDTDFIARYGGEEFAALLPNTDQRESLVAAEKFRKTVESIAGLDRKITMSVGATTLIVARDEPFLVETLRDKFIKQADDALYYSKENGRNRVTHFYNINEDDG